MSFEARLDELALRCGIEPHYWDIQGVCHVATFETKVGILRAMGIEIQNESDVERALYQLEESSWSLLCRPVIVIYEGSTELNFEVSLPERLASEVLCWQVKRTGFGGEVALPSIPPCDTKVFSNGDSFERKNVSLSIELSIGYYELKLDVGNHSADVLILVAPVRCYFPPVSGKLFGISAQLYSLGAHSDSIGDLAQIFTAVSDLSQFGVSFVGLNPLHALFENNAQEVSPYSPSSRLAWNSLIVSENLVPERQKNAKKGHQRNCPSDLVDYEVAWGEKISAFRRSFEEFRKQHYGKGTEREKAYETFLSQTNQGTKEYAIFAALREYLLKKDNSCWGWPAWPAEYRHPHSPSVREFVEKHKSEIDFHLYLQFLADSQLHELDRELLDKDITLGLYLDLALGANGGGAETWYRQNDYAFTMSMGAPPDELGPLGQVWGLPPLLPERLLSTHFSVFREALAKVMSRARVLRIDHIMSLFRLFWIPEGKQAKDGAYVRYPFHELLAIVSIESALNKCIVIGEDLGTVPDEVRHGMERTGILSYKVLYFMHEDRRFLPPESYPQRALVVASTHDLPTLKSFWSGEEIELRQKLGLFAEERLYALSKDLRARDRVGLHASLLEAELPSPEVTELGLSEDEVISFYKYLARTPCSLQAIQVEDLTLSTHQANVPGTVTEHPNWRRRVGGSLQEILRRPFVRALLDSIRQERRSS